MKFSTAKLIRILLLISTLLLLVSFLFFLWSAKKTAKENSIQFELISDLFKEDENDFPTMPQGEDWQNTEEFISEENNRGFKRWGDATFGGINISQSIEFFTDSSEAKSVFENKPQEIQDIGKGGWPDDWYQEIRVPEEQYWNFESKFGEEEFVACRRYREEKLNSCGYWVYSMYYRNIIVTIAFETFDLPAGNFYLIVKEFDEHMYEVLKEAGILD